MSAPEANPRQDTALQLPQYNTAVAIDFLRQLDSNGVHQLAAFDPATGAKMHETFRPGEWERKTRWIEKHQGRCNLYCSLNEPRPDLGPSRASAKDIISIRAIFVDFDPDEKAERQPGGLTSERQRLRAIVDDLLVGPDAPTLVVDSGGGFQAVWRLENKLPAGEHARAAQEQSRGLAYALGSDPAVSDTPRLIRLPGTANLPDSKKRKRGRVPRSALLLRADGPTTTLGKLAAIAPPKSAPASSQNIIDLPAVDMKAVTAAVDYDDLSESLRQKFEKALAGDPQLDRLWVGDKSAVGGGDESGSGFLFSLAELLRRKGFTATELGQLAYLWDCYPHKEKLDARQIQRAYAKAPPGATEEFLNPVDIPEFAPDGRSNIGRPSLSDRIAIPEGEDSAAEEQRHGAPPRIQATPFVWRDPSTIPVRQWLYAGHYIRKFTSCTIAPGGVGKSSLGIVDALAMATGRNLTGATPDRPLRVWIWNGEDPLEEMERRIAAACLHYGITEADIGGRLFLNSGRTTPLILAEQTRNGTTIAKPVVGAVTETIRQNQIDAMQVDPFISSHHVPENDNNAIDLVAKQWGSIAEATNCAVELVHHARKTHGNEITVEDGRGAVALISAARSARVLNRMTEDEGDRAGVENHTQYFRVSGGKANLTVTLPAAKAKWFHLASVNLRNDPIGLDGDSIGVATAWKWPDAFAGITTADLLKAQKAIDSGKWRENQQAKDWAGIPIARELGIDISDKPGKAKVKTIMETWIRNGALVVAEGQDDKRRTRKFIEVGRWATG